MATLYVIGNGFDLGHGLKTTYWDFRNYLGRCAEEFLVGLEKMYGIAPIDDMDWRIQYHYKEIMARRNRNIKSTLWQKFEHDLAAANENELLDFSSSIVDSLNLESGLVGIEDTLDQYWEEQYQFIIELQEYVFKWIRQVRLSKAHQQKSSFINNNQDSFLSFNYTNTLEKLYHIRPDHVLHIHGGLPPFCIEKPLLGHGDKGKIDRYRAMAETAANDFDEASTSIYNAIANYYERILKDTHGCIAKHLRFFDQLNNIDSVVVIGHSLGSVDFPYFELIKRKILNGSVWTVYYHASGDREMLENKLIRLGISSTNFSLKSTSDFWS